MKTVRDRVAFIGLTIRAKMIAGGRSLKRKFCIKYRPEPVVAKGAVFSRNVAHDHCQGPNPEYSVPPPLILHFNHCASFRSTSLCLRPHYNSRLLHLPMCVIWQQTDYFAVYPRNLYSTVTFFRSTGRYFYEHRGDMLTAVNESKPSDIHRRYISHRALCHARL